ncbi:HDIG domain-containing protein [Candidatus Woesearchaeota archaeon]|nr:HDIG domain-containing protein [Candidatus Woesearchaeota archaeon]
MESRIPSEQECLELMAEVGLASAVARHSVNVKNFALQLADQVEQRGIGVNRPLLAAAALLHDIKKMDAEVCHGIEGGEFLRKKGFSEVAKVVEKHCLINLDDPTYVPRTAEEKLLMYADLRVSTGRVVSLDERFDYIRKRYKPKDTKTFQEYITFAKQLEWELFGRVEKK